MAEGISVPPLEVVKQQGDSIGIDMPALESKASLTVRSLATLTWQNLRVVAKDVKGNDRVILDGVSGCTCPQHMVAIMGPSGCGKTTLLDTLAGRQARSVRVEGEVLLNGYPSKLKYGLSAYVTQDEMLVGTLSVRETLLYAARLRLPGSMAYADKVKRVDDVIYELGLVDAQHTKIGNWFIKGISGGQKRRVAIGCELITHPGILFLDEPTSGLDAAAAYHVMKTIRRLAEHDRTILSVIHQPSSEVFGLFDKLCLLSAGKVVYFGSAQQALTMFEEAGLPCPPLRNPTDHFLHCINKDFKEEGEDVEDNEGKLIALYEKSRLPQVEAMVKRMAAKGVEYELAVQQANPLYQNWVLTERQLINNWRNIGIFWLRLGMYVMLCICIGTIFLKLGYTWKDSYSKTSVMFFIVAFLTFMSISGFPAFEEDMRVFVRERLNGYYGVSTFTISNTVASAPFIFGIAVTCSLIVYWLVELNDDGDRFVYFFLNLYVSLTVVESLMMAIAAIVPHYLMGLAAGGGMLGMFMLVCGFFQPIMSIPAPFWRYPLHYMSFHSYAFAGFMQNEFDGGPDYECPCVAQGNCPSLPCMVPGSFVLDYWYISGLNKWVDLAIQVAMVAIYRFCFFCSLKLKEYLSS